jgi:ketosteroid isomerase-like protein
MAIDELVRDVYAALAAGDRARLLELLHDDFEGTVTDTLLFGIGGSHHGAEAMIEDVWWTIGRRLSVRLEPAEWIACADGRLLVTGRYVGRARATGASLDAAFAHLWTARDERLAAIWQLTDSAAWLAALDERG